MSVCRGSQTLKLFCMQVLPALSITPSILAQISFSAPFSLTDSVCVRPLMQRPSFKRNRQKNSFVYFNLYVFRCQTGRQKKILVRVFSIHFLNLIFSFCRLPHFSYDLLAIVIFWLSPHSVPRDTNNTCSDINASHEIVTCVSARI
jgi:hypothetical protein